MAEQDGRNRRRLVNMFIDPRMQIMLFLPYVVTLVAFVVTNLMTVRFTIKSFSAATLDPDPSSTMDLSDVYRRLMMMSSLGMIVAAVLGFVLVVVVSHRILGPLYNIQRHVRRLRQGEYHHNLILRKGDRLMDFADDLRAVTETLRSSVGNSAPKT